MKKKCVLRKRHEVTFEYFELHSIKCDAFWKCKISWASHRFVHSCCFVYGNEPKCMHVPCFSAIGAPRFIFCVYEIHWTLSYVNEFIGFRTCFQIFHKNPQFSIHRRWFSCIFVLFFVFFLFASKFPEAASSKFADIPLV